MNEQSTKDRSRDETQAGDSSIDSNRQAMLAWGKRTNDDRKGARRHDGRTDALDDTEDDQDRDT